MGIQPSIDHNMCCIPSSPKQKQNLVVSNMLNDVKELITILTKVLIWNKIKVTNKNPLYEYLKEHNDKVKRWIFKELPNDAKNSINGLTVDTKLVSIA